MSSPGEPDLVLVVRVAGAGRASTLLGAATVRARFGRGRRPLPDGRGSEEKRVSCGFEELTSGAADPDVHRDRLGDA